MADDARIRECFPHKTFRPGQFEFIKEAIEAFEAGKKYVIVEAPTGTGKTPGIITIAMYFTQGFRQAELDARNVLLTAKDEKVGMQQAQEILSPHQAHMITSLKMLQDQYLRDSKLVQIMKGKNNYTCHSASSAFGMSCSDHEAMYGRACKSAGRGKGRPCAYLAARISAQLARLTLHNFDSFINQVSLGGSFQPRALLTVDEAHGADEHLIKALSFELGRDHLEKLEVSGGWDPPKSMDDPTMVLPWLRTIDSNIERQEQTVNNEITRLQNMTTIRSADDEKALGRMGRRKQAIGDIRRRLARYIGSSDKPWAIEKKDNGAFTFEPVRSSFFAKSALLNFGARGLFMSATVFDKGRRLMNAMNMKNDETHYIAVKCIFPVHNRPLVDVAVADTGQKGYEASKKKIFESIEHILDLHPKERGVIHCNSYKMAEDIRNNVSSRRLMFHESNNRDDTVQRFTSGFGGDNAVLVGVFMREGYDFKDDLARFQILIRLPYAWPDKRIKMRDEMEKGYYDWLCGIDLVQTYGRGVRNELDHCVSYVLDNRLKRYLRRAGYMMPEWFKEAVNTPEQLGLTEMQNFVRQLRDPTPDNSDIIDMEP